MSPKSAQLAVKHTLDLVSALLMLVMFSPALVAIALALRLESPGPVLVRQRRLSRDGGVFDLLKFRVVSIAPVARSYLPPGASLSDSVESADRWTRVGQFLRRTSLEELPQLFNIVRGEMSLIGPRPERPECVEHIDRGAPRSDGIRPGLTGWAQVQCLRRQRSSMDRAERDDYYVEHWSLWLDVKILLLTIVALFQPTER